MSAGYTVGRDSDWTHLPTIISSRRHTTTSSRPGAVITGTVQVGKIGLVLCPKCGRKRYDFASAHSPHFTSDMRFIDCVGDLVPR